MYTYIPGFPFEEKDEDWYSEAVVDVELYPMCFLLAMRILWESILR